MTDKIQVIREPRINKKISNLVTGNLNKYIYLLVIISSCGLLSPLLNSNDAYFYAVISKTIATSNNWIDLYYAGSNWLDKPHFPFWITALSFKLFGINAFAYVLPGFLFHLLGAYYTYRLTRHLYNAPTGLIAAFIYLSSLHLMLSAMDVRAEAYLLGEIIPACYYWLIYDKSSSLKALLLAAFFSGLALMTKGIFVVVTIFSGIMLTWIYSRQWHKIISPKWLFAYMLSFICALPELICLYLQFDAHPEKLVFDQHNVSGLAWYFWGSQFGRFFNNGPIINTHGNPFFFVHTYLWAFLPWSIVFIIATYELVKIFRKNQDKAAKAKQIYLLASFWLTFSMFSATKFQLDHYTNIIMPFAAIWCADYIYKHHGMKLARLQLIISLALLTLTIGLTVYVFGLGLESMIAIVPVIMIGFILSSWRANNYLTQILIYPALAIAMVFIFAMLVSGQIYQKYDIGYNVAKIINQQVDTPIAIYQVKGVANSLNFHAKNQVITLENQEQYTGQLKNHALFMLIPEELASMSNPRATIVAHYTGIQMEKFIPALFKHSYYQNNLQHVKLIYLP